MNAKLARTYTTALAGRLWAEAIKLDANRLGGFERLGARQLIATTGGMPSDIGLADDIDRRHADLFNPLTLGGYRRRDGMSR